MLAGRRQRGAGLEPVRAAALCPTASAPSAESEGRATGCWQGGGGVVLSRAAGAGAGGEMRIECLYILSNRL